MANSWRSLRSALKEVVPPGANAGPVYFLEEDEVGACLLAGMIQASEAAAE